MGVKLSIEITTPLEPDDREMLTGLSIMVMAIANHELAKEHFPGVFPSPEEIIKEQQEAERQAAEEQAAQQPPMPCMAQGGGPDAGKSCISEVGHRGRHRFRFILPPTEGLN